MNQAPKITTRLTAIQRSMFWAFAYDLVENGELVGEILWPKVAQAKNARLRVLKDYRDGSITVNLHGVSYLVTFEHIRRGFTNDIRFEMVARNAPTFIRKHFLGTPSNFGCASEGDVPSDTPKAKPLVVPTVQPAHSEDGVYACARVLVPSGMTSGVNIELDYPTGASYRIKPISFSVKCDIKGPSDSIGTITRPAGLSLRRILNIDTTPTLSVQARAFLLFLTLNSLSR